MSNLRNNRHLYSRPLQAVPQQTRRTYKVVPKETPWQMAPHRPLRSVWWLRTDGWKDMTVRQYQRCMVAFHGFAKLSVQGNKR